MLGVSCDICRFIQSKFLWLRFLQLFPRQFLYRFLRLTLQLLLWLFRPIGWSIDPSTNRPVCLFLYLVSLLVSLD